MFSLCLATDLHRARCRQQSDIAQLVWEFSLHQLYWIRQNSQGPTPNAMVTVAKVSSATAPSPLVSERNRHSSLCSKKKDSGWSCIGSGWEDGRERERERERERRERERDRDRDRDRERERERERERGERRVESGERRVEREERERERGCLPYFGHAATS